MASGTAGGIPRRRLLSERRGHKERLVSQSAALFQGETRQALYIQRKDQGEGHFKAAGILAGSPAHAGGKFFRTVERILQAVRFERGFRLENHFVSFDAPADFDGWLICGLREVTGELWVEEIAVDTARPGEKPAVPEKSAETLKNEQADLGFVVLSRFSPNSFEFQQMLDSWRKRLGKADEYRDFLMNLYQGFAGNALSPNYCGWDRKGRIERLPKELAARFTDWRTNMQGLAKFGLHSSADSEITALQNC